jgi:hypothetical protein
MNDKFVKFVKFSIGVSLVLSFVMAASAQIKQPDIETLAKQFLGTNEYKLEETKDSLTKFSLLKRLAPAALRAGNKEKAAKYAAQLMIEAKNIESTPAFGPGEVAYATHISNTVLGYIAMDEGNLDKAKEYLLASGELKSKHSVLVSFGPRMGLAKRLLEKGERETVIKYFDLCANFWELEDGRLAKWKKIVEEGKIPDFGPSLSIDSWRFA